MFDNKCLLQASKFYVQLDYVYESWTTKAFKRPAGRELSRQARRAA